MTSHQRIKDRTVLLTGATGGLGEAFSRAFLAAGAKLVLLSAHQDKLDALSTSLCDEFPEAEMDGYCVDLEDADSLNGVSDDIQCKHTIIDILVNNAGVFPVEKFTLMSLDDFDCCFAVNVRAPFLLVKKFIPAMINQAWGRIVNIGSSSAYAGFPNTAAYCASKHALLGLSRSLHAEYKDDGIRCYSLSPGSVQTQMGKQVPDQDFSTFIKPEEVASYVIFLLGQDGNMISEEVRLNRMIVR